MGILVAGLIGQVRNKVGNMVFSNWKGINTARAYAVPANPQSVNQTAQRTKFAAVVALAQNLLGTLITTFINPFAVQMSGFNRFIQLFIENASATGLVTASCQVVAGTLESVSGLTAQYTTGTGSAVVNWATTQSGNGLATDDINFLAIRNTDNKILAYQLANATRGDGTYNLSLATGLTATGIIIFAWYSRGTGSSFIVSDSLGVVCTAP